MTLLKASRAAIWVLLFVFALVDLRVAAVYLLHGRPVRLVEIERSRVAVEVLPWRWDELALIVGLIVVTVALIWGAWRVQKRLKRA